MVKRAIEKICSPFCGGVVNVSGWNDNDKQGGKYRDYFINASSYSITNYGGVRGKAQSDIQIDEYQVDLTKAIPDSLIGKFDVAFNHTTLEHIYDNRTAFRNLCRLAQDAVIVVVPWVQEVHVTESFSDYWRYSPYAMEKLFDENGFSMVICSYNDDQDTAVYLFCIGIRNEKLKKYPMFSKVNLSNDKPAGGWIGRPSLIDRIIGKIQSRMR